MLDKPHLDLTTKIGQGFLAFLSALAEDERERTADPELYERCLAAGSYPSPSSADGPGRQDGNLPLS